MAKITVVLCDVKPCKLPAQREIEINGEKVFVCGENCFVKFWSREYQDWNKSPYGTQIFNELTPPQIHTPEQSVNNEVGRVDIFGSNLRVVKPPYNC